MKTNFIFGLASFQSVILAGILISASSVNAATFKIEFDDTTGGKHNDATLMGSVVDGNFSPIYGVFRSRGGPKGSIITNRSQFTIEDIHIRLTSVGDTFDPTSTGGGAFPNTMFSQDMREVSFSGGNIKPLGTFWSKIPLSATEGGAGTYEGRLTPSVCVLLPPRSPAPRSFGEASPDPDTGSDFMLSPGEPCTSIPEPSSTLSLLALGTLGAGSILKRKQKQQKSEEKTVGAA